MPGERGLDGELRGDPVADLADQDDVGVRAQDRRQHSRERQPGLVVHLHLIDAGQPVLDWVLDGDDVDLGLADLGQRRVQRRRLARAGRAGDQQHAVRLGEGLGEAGVVVLAETEPFEVQVDGAGVEHAQDDLLTPHGRQGGDPQVDAAATQLDGDPAVLRDASLGDVDVGHDLQAADQGRLHRARHRVDLVQHAVDAVAHPHVALGRLEVQVGGPVLDRLLDQRVGVAHDRRVLAHRGEAGQARDVLDSQAGGDVVEVVVRALEAVDRLVQLVAGHDYRPDEQSGRGADVVDREDVARVGQRDHDLVVVDGDAEHPMPAGERHGDLRRRGEVDRVADEVDALETVGLGQCLGELDFGDDALVDQDVTQRPSGFVGRADGLVEYLVGQPADAQCVEHWSVGLVHRAAGIAVGEPAVSNESSPGGLEDPGAANSSRADSYGAFGWLSP